MHDTGWDIDHFQLIIMSIKADKYSFFINIYKLGFFCFDDFLYQKTSCKY